MLFEYSIIISRVFHSCASKASGDGNMMMMVVVVVVVEVQLLLVVFHSLNMNTNDNILLAQWNFLQARK